MFAGETSDMAEASGVKKSGNFFSGKKSPQSFRRCPMSCGFQKDSGHTDLIDLIKASRRCKKVYRDWVGDSMILHIKRPDKKAPSRNSEEPAGTNPTGRRRTTPKLSGTWQLTESAYELCRVTPSRPDNYPIHCKRGASFSREERRSQSQ